MKRVTDKVWKLSAGSNIYFLDLEKKIIIDTGDRNHRDMVLMMLKTVVEPKDVEIIIFTHLHYDHIGNYDLFPNAKFYASKEEIECFRNNPKDTTVKEDYNINFEKRDLHELPEKIEGLEVVHTPGHTKGSICVWYPQKRVLFSGDTIFDKRILGRTDLPTSSPDDMARTLINLSRYPYEILCPGHDY